MLVGIILFSTGCIVGPRGMHRGGTQYNRMYRSGPVSYGPYAPPIVRR